MIIYDHNTRKGHLEILYASKNYIGDLPGVDLIKPNKTSIRTAGCSEWCLYVTQAVLVLE